MRISLDRKSFPLEVEVQDTDTNQKHDFEMDWAYKPDRSACLVVDGVEVEKKVKPKPPKPEGSDKKQ